MIGAILALVVVVIVPHPDDEITVLPDIRAAGPNAIVVVMTDGAATGHCPPLDLDAAACEARRRESFEGFMAERAPLARLVWVGEPDRGLTVEAVLDQIRHQCAAGAPCRVIAAGTDYGHPDHNAVRDAVAIVGGDAYNGALRWDLDDYTAAVRWYGWLGIFGPPRHGLFTGLSAEAWE